MDEQQFNKIKVENQQRGFKPIIPIAMPISQMPLEVLKQANIPIETKVGQYYQRYLSLLKELKLINVTVEHVNKQKAELREKYEYLQSQQREENENKKKRHRRNASQISRDFECPVNGCDKRYGAEASLSQHIKIKHAKFFASPEYEKFISGLEGKREESH